MALPSHESAEVRDNAANLDHIKRVPAVHRTAKRPAPALRGAVTDFVGDCLDYR